MNGRLYTVVTVDEVEGFDEDDMLATLQPPFGWPRWAEWDEFCMERYGETKPFFMPKSGQIYKSRSSAVARADLINYWGGNAEVLECTPVWESLEEAKNRRERERLVKRREKAVREAGELAAKIRDLS